jgi:hypothetical protein
MSTIRVTNLRDVNGNNGLVLNGGAVSVPGTLAVSGTATCNNLQVNGTLSGLSNQLIPSQTGNSGRFLTTDGSSPSWGTLQSEISDIRGLESGAEGGTRKAAASLITMHQRANQGWTSWTSNGPWTTIYAYGANGQTDAEQWAQLATQGIATRNASSSAWTYEGYVDYHRKLKWATGRELGVYSTDHSYATQASNLSTCVNMWPIRNFHPSLTKTVSVFNQYSNYWSSGFEGSSMWYYAPSTNGTYDITGGTWNNTNSRTSGNSQGYTWSTSFNIPPNTTYVVMMVNSAFYWTSFTGNYILIHQNMFYNIDSTMADPYIQTDFRVLQALEKGDLYRYGWTANNAFQFFRVYNAAADMYGNR